MTKKEFALGLKILQSSYSRDFNEEDVKIWYMQFKDEDGQAFHKAVKNIIRTFRFMPSIADILYEIKKIEIPDLTLNYEQEFENVRKAIRQYGLYRTAQLMASLKPKTRETVRRIGLQRICECEQDKLKFIKNEFKEIFENMQDYDYQNTLIDYSPVQEEIRQLTNRLRLGDEEE